MSLITRMTVLSSTVPLPSGAPSSLAHSSATHCL